MFITFEGTEGSGKSEQAHRLVTRLRDRGMSVVATHEPGGTALGSELRQLILQREELNSTARAEWAQSPPPRSIRPGLHSIGTIE